MFITDPDYNQCLVEHWLSYFTPRRQLDFKADRWAEALYQKIEQIRELKKLRPKRRARRKETKPRAFKQREPKTNWINVKKANKIPLDHKLYVPIFAPEGTPFPAVVFRKARQ